jgi:hypothetical protein
MSKSTTEHGPNCEGCRELALVNAVREIERLCLNGFAFENPHPISGGKGRDVITVDDVMTILATLPPDCRLREQY